MKKQGFPRNGRKGAKNEDFRDSPLFLKYKHYDLDMERACLAAIWLFSKTGMARVRSLLHAEFFYSDLHRSVYKAMVAMYDVGTPIDMFTLINYLTKHPDETMKLYMSKYGPDGWAHELTAMSMFVTSDAHLEYWAFLIREQYVERQMVLLTTAGMGEAGARDKILQIQQKIDEILQFGKTDDWMHISEVIIKLYQHMQEVEGKDLVGVPSGLPKFDKITGGFPCGLFYLGARPSVGKTALALKMILNQAQEGYPVGIISLETPGAQLAARALSMASGIEFWRIFRARLESEQRKTELYTYAQSMSQLPIYVSDTPAVTGADIRSKTLKLVARGAKVIYLDYLQLVEPDEGAGTREQEVARLSRGLKLLSMQTGIPIIALAQLSRESEKRQGTKKPRLIDLRESGSLEQDADGVMLLHRDWKVGIQVDEDGNSTEHQAQLLVEKWRNGETFEHELEFAGDKMEFSEPQGVPF